MIPPEIDLHEGALRELRKAYRWYFRRSRAAARRFYTALVTALQEIADHPARWPEYLYGTRFRLLRRFPFVVVYRRRDHQLQVVAVADGRRRTGYWKRRLS